ncbi:MAG: PilN domain-containing protein [Rubrobacteraceae bacterium]
MRRINLLPPEERRRGISRYQGGPLGPLLIIGAVVVMLIALVTIFSLVRIYMIENRIAELDESIAEQNERLEELQPFAELESEIAAKRPVADGIVRTRFAWSEFLRGLAFVIPETSSLESLAAEASPVDVDAPLDQIVEPRGSVTFLGLSEPGYTNIADFVVRMNTLRFLANAQLDIAELDRETYVSEAIDFEISSELLTEVGAEGAEVRIDGEEVSPAAEDQYSNEDQATLSNAAQAQYQGQAGRPGVEAR